MPDCAGPRWPASPEALRSAQETLGRERPPPWTLTGVDHPAIAGCFVCFPTGASGAGREGDPAWAAAALVRASDVLSSAVVATEAGAPYEPGLLALRAGPALELVVRGLAEWPDVLLVNATGRDHPRHAGLALHLGAVLDLPTVGITHRPLLATGEWPGADRASRSPLRLAGEVVGCWLRTRRGARPLAVHAGWRTDPETAADIVLAATAAARTPEPLREARRLARAARARGL